MRRYDYDEIDYEAWREECDRRALDASYADMLNRAYRTGPYEIKESRPHYERPDDYYIDAMKDGYYDDGNDERYWN